MRAGLSTTMSVCGRILGPERLTTKRGEATCRRCNPTNAMINRRRDARYQPGYADINYSGSGVLKCGVCGKPYRDHRVAQQCVGVG